MIKRRKISTGQRYAQVVRRSTQPMVWRVERVFEDALHIPHAFMVKSDDSSSTKTVACSLLSDEMHYRFVTEGAARR